MTALEAVAQLGEIFELQVAVGTRIGRDLLVIDPQGITHVMKQAGDGIGRDGNAEFGQFLGDRGWSCGETSVGRSWDHPRYRVRAGNGERRLGRRFFVGVRPPPVRRDRPLTTF